MFLFDAAVAPRKTDGLICFSRLPDTPNTFCRFCFFTGDIEMPFAKRAGAALNEPVEAEIEPLEAEIEPEESETELVGAVFEPIEEEMGDVLVGVLSACPDGPAGITLMILCTRRVLVRIGFRTVVGEMGRSLLDLIG